jgi:hypothetical protein
MTTVRKIIDNVRYYLGCLIIAIGIICFMFFLLILGIGLPAYLVWQGGWVGLFGLLAYILFFSLGKAINNRI